MTTTRCSVGACPADDTVSPCPAQGSASQEPLLRCLLSRARQNVPYDRAAPTSRARHLARVCTLQMGSMRMALGTSCGQHTLLRMLRSTERGPTSDKCSQYHRCCRRSVDAQSKRMDVHCIQCGAPVQGLRLYTVQTVDGTPKGTGLAFTTRIS